MSAVTVAVRGVRLSRPISPNTSSGPSVPQGGRLATGWPGLADGELARLDDVEAIGRLALAHDGSPAVTGTSTTRRIAASRRDAGTPANSGSVMIRAMVASYGVGARSAAVPIMTTPRMVRTIVATPATPSDRERPERGQEDRQQERTRGAGQGGNGHQDPDAATAELVGHEALEDRRRDDVDDQGAGREHPDRDEGDGSVVAAPRAIVPRPVTTAPTRSGAPEASSQDQGTRADPTDQPTDTDRRVQVAVGLLARLQDVDREDDGDDLEAAAEEPGHELDERQAGEWADLQGSRSRRLGRSLPAAARSRTPRVGVEGAPALVRSSSVAGPSIGGRPVSSRRPGPPATAEATRGSPR